MTLDEMLAEAKTLNDDDLTLLLRHLGFEQERRYEAERNEDWKVLCDQITSFTRKWSCITVFDNDVGVMNLRLGQYTFPAFGEIEVSA